MSRAIASRRESTGAAQSESRRKSAILGSDVLAKISVEQISTVTRSCYEMDEANPLDKLDAAWLALKSPVAPIMGGAMLWEREVKRKEESLKERSERPEKTVPVLIAETTPIEGFGTIVSTRTNMMVKGIDEAKVVAKKTASDIVSGFIDAIPDDGDDLRSAIRINALLKDLGTLIRKHQVV